MTFRHPSKLGQDAALALEDYARAVSAYDAVAEKDDSGHVIAVRLSVDQNQPGPEVAEEIERFFDSLVSESADRLGWS